MGLEHARGRGNGASVVRGRQGRRWIASTLVVGVVLTACGGRGAGGERTEAADPASRAPAPGAIHTVAGTGEFGDEGVDGPATRAQFAAPVALAFDDRGNLYVAERSNHRIVMVDPAGTLTLVAGASSVRPGVGGDGGPAVEADLNLAWGVAVGPDGNVYIADTGNHRVRMVDGDGIITTVVGTGEWGFSGDGGPGADAELNKPVGLAFDAEGSLYIWDTGNLRVRKVDPAGIITTVVGTGESGSPPDGTPATQAGLRSPSEHQVGLAVDPAGRLHLTDTGSNRIVMVDDAGLLRTVAGGDQVELVGDGGPAVEAGLPGPLDVAIGPDGTLYVATHWHGPGEGNRVRAVDGNRIITTVAGSATSGYSGDGGPATEAELDLPAAVAIGPDGNLYIADAGNNLIRMVEL